MSENPRASKPVAREIEPDHSSTSVATSGRSSIIDDPSIDNISAWQRDYFAAQVVFAVYDSGGDMLDIHDSEESARIQLAWCHGLGGMKRACMRRINLHNLDLSWRRWHTSPPAAPTVDDGDRGRETSVAQTPAPEDVTGEP